MSQPLVNYTILELWENRDLYFKNNSEFIQNRAALVYTMIFKYLSTWLTQFYVQQSCMREKDKHRLCYDEKCQSIEILLYCLYCDG